MKTLSTLLLLACCMVALHAQTVHVTTGKGMMLFMTDKAHSTYPLRGGGTFLVSLSGEIMTDPRLLGAEEPVTITVELHYMAEKPRRFKQAESDHGEDLEMSSIPVRSEFCGPTQLLGKDGKKQVLGEALCMWHERLFIKVPELVVAGGLTVNIYDQHGQVERFDVPTRLTENLLATMAPFRLQFNGPAR